MKLYEYHGKHVRITDIDGKVFIGYAADYTSELDDPDGVASLAIEPKHNPDRILIEFTEAEIASIEIMSSDMPAMFTA